MKRFLTLITCVILGIAIGYFIAGRVLKAESGRPSEQVPQKKEAVLPRTAPAKPSPVKVYPPSKYFIAIVLDDWGYNTSALKRLPDAETPLTLAVLPHLPYSGTIAKKAYEAGHEIILHMPMQPKKDVPLEEGTLLVSMDDGQIRTLLDKAMQELPFIRGVSNHMGSRFTEDNDRMRAVIEAVESKGLFYFDSLVTGDTAAKKIIAERGGTYIARDVFLDNERTEEAVLRQLDILKDRAMQNGMAIGIGHDEVVTVEAIKRVTEDWRRSGIELVTLSDYLKRKSSKKEYLQHMEKVVAGYDYAGN